MLPDVPFALEHVEQKKSVRRTLHVIHCLSGNDPSFIEEWEIGMKSVLVNAPLDSNLHIHLIADNNAAKEIDSIASKKKWAEKGSSGFKKGAGPLVFMMLHRDSLQGRREKVEDLDNDLAVMTHDEGEEVANVSCLQR
eukprot:scaffold2930_cov329-Chaetoceros_neogracile.AAC.1